MILYITILGLTLLLVGLRIAGAAEISWWWVFSPIWIPIFLVLWWSFLEAGRHERKIRREREIYQQLHH